VPSSDITTSTDLMETLTAAGIAAAVTILECRQDGAFRVKADGSPVTPADEAAEAVIRERLKQAAPAWPIVSEEQAVRERPKVGTDYFLVDPLDGTREFIGGRDEYTVNIGVVSGGAPALGIVVAPALGLIWRGSIGRGAERLQFSSGKVGPPQAIHARKRPDDEVIVMVSRSHLDPPTQAYVDALPRSRPIACGSSVKFCRLAEGVADLYPRLGPTRDWDVAAGHAVLVAAGGSVTAPDGGALAYGTADLLIPAFVAWGAPPPKGAVKPAGQPLKD
jgi:3'(2'), 5'-bisphosphate nucleotidase